MQRRAIWEDNKRKIEEHNQGFLLGRMSFAMAMNKYGDLVRSAALLSRLFLTETPRNNYKIKPYVEVCSLSPRTRLTLL